MDRVDPTCIETFVRVVQAGSLTAAARHMRLPKSTLSRRLTRLERQVGARLIRRSSRGMQLTQEGEHLMARAAPAIEALTEVAAQVAAGATQPRGTVRLTAPQDFGTVILPQALTEFVQRYPEVSVDVELTDRIVDMVQEGFDLAVRAGKLSDSTLVSTQPIAVRFWLAASPSFLDEHGRPQRPADLASLPTVLFRSDDFSAQWRLSHPKRQPISVQVRARLSSKDLTLLEQLLERGAGVGMLPHFLMRGAVQAGRLERVLAPWSVGMGGVYLVHASSRQLPSRVQVLRDFLHEHLAAAGRE